MKRIVPVLLAAVVFAGPLSGVASALNGQAAEALSAKPSVSSRTSSLPPAPEELPCRVPILNDLPDGSSTVDVIRSMNGAPRERRPVLEGCVD